MNMINYDLHNNNCEYIYHNLLYIKLKAKRSLLFCFPIEMSLLTANLHNLKQNFFIMAYFYSIL